MLKRIVLFCMITFAVYAESYVLSPSDDMYTDPDHSDVHMPGELWTADYDPAGQHQRINMKFDLEDYAGTDIESATLRLNRFFGCPSGGATHTHIDIITQQWEEDTWADNVHITYSTDATVEYSFAVNGWHDIDITSIVSGWLDGEYDNYGIVIRALPGSKWSKFYSKESATSSLRPQLVLETTDKIAESQFRPEIHDITVYPNPFNSTCNIESNCNCVEILDINGNTVYKSTENSFNWTPETNIKSGVYFVVGADDNAFGVNKIYYIK